MLTTLTLAVNFHVRTENPLVQGVDLTDPQVTINGTAPTYIPRMIFLPTRNVS